MDLRHRTIRVGVTLRERRGYEGRGKRRRRVPGRRGEGVRVAVRAGVWVGVRVGVRVAVGAAMLAAMRAGVGTRLRAGMWAGVRAVGQGVGHRGLRWVRVLRWVRLAFWVRRGRRCQTRDLKSSRESSLGHRGRMFCESAA